VNFSELKGLFTQAGVVNLYAKFLAENDNSKNQVYLGPNFEALNLFPIEEIVADSTGNTQIFKAKLRFGWLTGAGLVAPAPGAQLILYPQYPEVRFSGFLRACDAAPSALMGGRHTGRMLFLGVTKDGAVVGHVVGPNTEIAAETRCLAGEDKAGVFIKLSLPAHPDEVESRASLLAALGRIHRLGWIDSKQLDTEGRLRPCHAPQCGGFTLEAELGIPKNSKGEPDFLGWEVKQYAVKKFGSTGGPITLMTPEPTGGFYKTHGPEAFIRKFGYSDKRNRQDRMNFGGIHRVDVRQPCTGLTLRLRGFDARQRRIIDVTGSVLLATDAGEVAMEWAFTGLLKHWARKHSRAVYIPAMKRDEPSRQYAFGQRVRLAQTTDGLRLLDAMSRGVVYYDPGIKLEHISSIPLVKRRSQFRIPSKSIGALYESVDTIEV
jgi:hypothetical protein